MNSQVMEISSATYGASGEQEFRLLLVGSVEDHDDYGSSIFNQFPWRTQRVRGCQEARPLILQNLTGVVVCERDLPDGNWKDVLEMTATRKEPPAVVVTFRLADEHLWAEVLNLGGYDVLAKPLDRTEVNRTINLAWQHWANQRDLAEQKSEDKYVYQSGRTDQARR